MVLTWNDYRSGCSQCQAAGIVCTWPEQRKRFVFSLSRIIGWYIWLQHRGPAKGYIEGLEHRLHEAESLLLQLLPIVPSEQLELAAAGVNGQRGSQGRDSPDGHGRKSPPILNKKTGIEYWDKFPLDSADNIRRWQQDCALQGHIREEAGRTSRSQSASLETSREQPVGRETSGISMSSDMSNPPSLNYNLPSPQRAWNSEYSGRSQSTAEADALLMHNFTNQSWQQQQAYAIMQRQSMPQQQAQQIPQESIESMDIDTTFFPDDSHRRLFW